MILSTISWVKTKKKKLISLLLSRLRNFYFSLIFHKRFIASLQFYFSICSAQISEAHKIIIKKKTIFIHFSLLSKYLAFLSFNIFIVALFIWTSFLEDAEEIKNKIIFVFNSSALKLLHVLEISKNIFLQFKEIFIHCEYEEDRVILISTTHTQNRILEESLFY